MQGKLFIVGNGLDLYFGLPTSTNCFCDKLKLQVVDDIADINAENLLDFYQRYNVFWSEWEEGLADLNVEDLEQLCQIAPDYMSDSEEDREGTVLQVEDFFSSILSARDDALHEMIKDAERMLESDQDFGKYNEQLFNSSNSYIINFNYTSTIESLFCLDKTVINYHIHGSFEDDKLLFGYTDETLIKKYRKDLEERTKYDEQADPFIVKQEDEVIEFYSENKKILQLKELEERFCHINRIDQVVVLGHSMAGVDSKYFELIERMFHPSEWTVSYYGSEPDLGMYSFANKIKFQPFEQLIKS